LSQRSCLSRFSFRTKETQSCAPAGAKFNFNCEQNTATRAACRLDSKTIFHQARTEHKKLQTFASKPSDVNLRARRKEKNHQHGKTLPDMKKMKKIGVAGEAGSAVK
jgi:hypothetical protein